MDEVTRHAQEIVRLSEQIVSEKTQQPPYNAEVAMSSWDTKPLPLSDQVIMRNICVRVRPVLQEMLKRMREQQTRLDALELLVLNLIQDEKET